MRLGGLYGSRRPNFRSTNETAHSASCGAVSRDGRIKTGCLLHRPGDRVRHHLEQGESRRLVSVRNDAGPRPILKLLRSLKGQRSDVKSAQGRVTHADRSCRRRQTRRRHVRGTQRPLGDAALGDPPRVRSARRTAAGCSSHPCGRDMRPSEESPQPIRSRSAEMIFIKLLVFKLFMDYLKRASIHTLARRRDTKSFRRPPSQRKSCFGEELSG